MHFLRSVLVLNAFLFLMNALFHRVLFGKNVNFFLLCKLVSKSCNLGFVVLLALLPC